MDINIADWLLNSKLFVQPSLAPTAQGQPSESPLHCCGRSFFSLDTQTGPVVRLTLYFFCFFFFFFSFPVQTTTGPFLAPQRLHGSVLKSSEGLERWRRMSVFPCKLWRWTDSLCFGVWQIILKCKTERGTPLVRAYRGLPICTFNYVCQFEQSASCYYYTSAKHICSCWCSGIYSKSKVNQSKQ